MSLFLQNKVTAVTITSRSTTAPEWPIVAHGLVLLVHWAVMSGATGSQAKSCCRAPRKTCQVEGCCKDLSCLRPYRTFSESAFVESTMATDQVDVAGAPHRFCQKCGRLEPLDAFDGAKRSCVKKLQLHSDYLKRKRAKAVRVCFCIASAVSS